MRRLYVTAIALLGAAPYALAQVPVIVSGGVENAASNVTLTAIAPQVLIAIKGQNLATSTAAASGYPLPKQLGGVTVSFSTSSGTVLAPLFYASSTQINAQVPNGIAGANIVVTTPAGSSAPYNIPLVSGAIPKPIGPLGIFTDDGTGCGQAVAFNIPSNGSPLSPNSPQNSFDPEKDLGLAIYLTGLGGNEYTDRPNGVPWVYNGSDNLVPQLVSSGTSLTSVTFGAPGFLDAGALTVSGPGIGSTVLKPSTSGGRLTYQATLPAGTLQGGTYQVTGQGGSQVADFTANADIPAPIQVTSSLSPGTQLERPCEGVSYISIGSFPPYCAGSYSISWTGGDSLSIVTVQLFVGRSFQAVVSAYGYTGNIFIPESYGPPPDWCQDAPFDPVSCVLIPTGDVEVVIAQTPFHEPSQPFSAPGLAWGGAATWKYVWDYRGLTN